MLLKILASLIILFSSIFFSFYLINKIKLKINNLQQISNSLEILQTELKFIIPLDQAAKNISSLQSNIFIQTFFFNLYLNIQQKSDCAKNIWLNQINLLSNQIFIDPDDILILNSFSQVISSLDQNLQINYLKKIILSLEKKISYLQKIYIQQKKLYFNLSILFALLIIIILI